MRGVPLERDAIRPSDSESQVPIESNDADRVKI